MLDQVRWSNDSPGPFPCDLLQTRPNAGQAAMAHDELKATVSTTRPKRERSTRYPGVELAECLKLCESIEQLGVDGLSSADIATALGYKNIKTNTFSARLSAARQFGLLTLAGTGYNLSPLAREILHPVDPSELPRLYRQALLKPPLYAELAERLGGKKVPEAPILGNVLYHHHQIIASAKQSAAEAFLASARFAQALGDDGVFLPGGVASAAEMPAPPSSAAMSAGPTLGVARAAPASAPQSPSPSPSPVEPASVPRVRTTDVRLDLRLWDADAGKTIRLRAPQSISTASFDRFLQAFRLVVRIDDPPAEG